MKPRVLFVAVLYVSGACGIAFGQSSTLIDDRSFKALIDESSGEMGLVHFGKLLAFSGYAPSRGAEQIAEYLAEQARASGLSSVHIEKFPSDGKLFYWGFRSEPWWEAKRAELWLVEPERKRIASFDAYRGYLARFSRSADVTTELVDVGAGTSPSDYKGKSVAGKMVLAYGSAGEVHRLAVWENKAAGVLVYRVQNHYDEPDLIRSASVDHRDGPNGEPPAFAFSVSYRGGRELSERLGAGERLVVHAEVDTETRRDGYYPQVHATIPGTEPDLPAVWIQAHNNYRSSAGGNNLTGVGVTVDLARTFASLMADGRLPRPRRNIHFVWGAEHKAIIYYFYQYPEAIPSVLAFLNLDMVGDHQELSNSILRLYRTPYSTPSFVNDVVQEMFETVSAGNTTSLRHRGVQFLLPVLEPSGSRDQFFYKIEEFWGPSDHEDVTPLGLHAVLLNTWPDPYIGTNEDTKERADATQMKRATVIAGASAYILATAGPREIPVLVQNALGKARARLAEEERRAMDLLWQSSSKDPPEDRREAANIIARAYERETKALGSLEVFATGDERALEYISDNVNELAGGESAAQVRLRRHARAVARSSGVDLKEPGPRIVQGSALLVPVRSPEIKGPVSVTSAQYGRDWLAEKLADPTVLDEVRLAARGRYYAFETLNFADGKRNLQQIRDAVAAEYGPAPLDEVEQYFRVLEQAGVVELREPGRGTSR